MWCGSSREASVDGLFCASNRAVSARRARPDSEVDVDVGGGARLRTAAGREACALNRDWAERRRVAFIMSMPSSGLESVALVDRKRAFRGRAEKRWRHEEHIEAGLTVLGRMVAMSTDFSAVQQLPLTSATA